MGMDEQDIIIVGAGVAGMTAAIYGLRAGKSVVVFEKMSAGGQILETEKIANYPGFKEISGKELAGNMREQVKALGGEIKSAEVMAIEREEGWFRVETDDEPVVARTVIIANGSKERVLGIPGEEELTGAGVSYCATCDGALYKDKDVVVYGGGNTAAYSVLYLAGFCKKVYWLFRKPEPRADAHLVERIRELSNVEIWEETEIMEIYGKKKVEGVVTSREKEFEGATTPVEIRAEGVFMLVGREADNQRFSDLVELDHEGYIDAGEDCTTSCEGVFAAGDTRAKKVHQVVTAAADGAVAAEAAIDYINSQYE